MKKYYTEINKMFNSELPDVNINDFYKYYFYNLHKLRF